MQVSITRRVKILFTAVCLAVLTPGLYAQQPSGLPTYNTSKPLAFVREWTAKAPGLTATSILQKGLAEVSEGTVYLDGYGRPIQTVARKAALATNNSSLLDTSTASDIISPQVYDAFGRSPYQLMPFAHSSQNGQFDASVFTHQYQALTTKYAADGETKFYSENTYGTGAVDALSIVASYAQGNAWVGSKSNPDPNQQRSVKANIYFSTSSDSVDRLKVVYGSPGSFCTVKRGADVYGQLSYYSQGELTKKISENEDHKQVIQYVDDDGRLLLQKIQLTAVADGGSGSGYEGWLCTYYVYDDMDRLRVVVQPEGVKALLQNGWNFTSTILNEQCFRYEYDKYGQVVMKKFPGAGAEYMVYDKLGRLVMAQSARNRAQNIWNYIQYDDFNRTIATGTLVSSTSLTSLWSQARLSTSYPTLDYTAYELSHTYYDNYSWIGSSGSPFVSGDAAYSNSYDGYFVGGSSGSFPYPEANTVTSNTRGMVTGSKLAVLGGSQYLYSLSLYNDKGRNIQTKSFNHTGAAVPDVATAQYSWSGQVLTAVSAVNKAGTNALRTVTATTNTYDMLGRLLTSSEKVAVTMVATSTTVNTEKIPVRNLYDELGQLKTRQIGVNPLNTAQIVETQDFEYNVRGWQKGLNRSYITVSAGSRYFGYELAYDKANTGIGLPAYGKSLFTGNITGVTWRGQAHGAEVNRYDFDYDATGRLLKATFGQYNGSAFSNSSVNFNMQMGDGANPLTAYDANGNILKMSQHGLTAPGGGVIQVDDLSYQYVSGTNKLAKVTDAITNTASYNLADFKDGTNGGDDYDYDVDGGLVKDENKGITSISYNLLGLVEQVVVQSKGTITYQYSADGSRLSKTTTPQSGSPVTSLYVGSMVFDNNVLQFIGMSGGRIRFNASSALVADYFLSDHLGNTRMVVTDDAGVANKVLEENHYYPFGLNMAGMGAKQTISGVADNKYKFNAATELNSNFDVNLYETAFRGLDPQLGRFWQVDPIAGIADAFSTFAFANNNPVLLNDPFGLVADSLPMVFTKGYRRYRGYDYGDAERLFDQNMKDANAYFVSIWNPKRWNEWLPEVIVTVNKRQINERREAQNRLSDALNKIGVITGAMGLSLDLTTEISHGGQALANALYKSKSGIVDIGKYKLFKGVTVGKAGRTLGYIGIIVTAADMKLNGVNWRNSTDLAVGAVSFIPGVGWVIGATYFIGDAIVTNTTGKSIGEWIGFGVEDGIIAPFGKIVDQVDSWENYFKQIR